METKKAPINISFEDVSFSISPKSSDQWFFVQVTDYRLDIPVIGYDVHYCEDYNEICVYRVNEGSVDYDKAVHKQSIK